MEEKKLMEVNDEIETTEEEVEETFERSGIGTGWAMLIGSGLTLAAIAAGKKANLSTILFRRKSRKRRRGLRKRRSNGVPTSGGYL